MDTYVKIEQQTNKYITSKKPIRRSERDTAQENTHPPQTPLKEEGGGKPAVARSWFGIDF